MSLPAKIIKEMAGIWEIEGEPSNLEQYIRAKGQADRRRNTEFQLQANNRSTVSILFPDEKTVQLLFTVGETKKIEPITAMLDAPVPMIDPETSTMLDIELLVEDTAENSFTVRVKGRSYGEERIKLSLRNGTLTQTSTIVDQMISCVRVYKQSQSMATDDFRVNYRQQLNEI